LKETPLSDDEIETQITMEQNVSISIAWWRTASTFTCLIRFCHWKIGAICHVHCFEERQDFDFHAILHCSHDCNVWSNLTVPGKGYMTFKS
jgi:hypothetical protein